MYKRPPTKRDLAVAMYQKGIDVDVIAELLHTKPHYVHEALAGVPLDSVEHNVSHYQHEHPNTLALYCSDGRFTRAVEDLCATLDADRIDTVTIPGGPGLLDVGKLALSDRAVVTKSLGFLIAGHKIEQVVLVAHAGCGYYRTRYPRKSAAEIEVAQRADLVSAREYVSREYRVEAHCYYANVVDNKIQFDHIVTT